MALTQQKILDAEEDLNDLAAIINGPADQDVQTRTGGLVPTLKKRLAPYDNAGAVAAAAQDAKDTSIAARDAALGYRDQADVSAGVANTHAQNADLDRQAAEAAKVASEEARDSSIAARDASIAARDTTLGYRDTAAQHAADADADRIAAEAAKVAAEAARDEATAQTMPEADFVRSTVGTALLDSQGILAFNYDNVTKKINVTVGTTTDTDAYDRLAYIGGDGGMVVGNYIDFHDADNDGTDFRSRLQALGNNFTLQAGSAGTGTFTVNSTDVILNGTTLWVGGGEKLLVQFTGGHGYIRTQPDAGNLNLGSYGVDQLSFFNGSIGLSSPIVGYLPALTTALDLCTNDNYLGTRVLLNTNAASPGMFIGYAGAAGDLNFYPGGTASVFTITSAGARLNVGELYLGSERYPRTSVNNVWNGEQKFVNTGNIQGATAAPGLQAYNLDGSGGAHIAFNRNAAYGIYFGLDSDNWMRLGGWSSPVRAQWSPDGDFYCPSMGEFTTPNAGTTGGLRLKAHSSGGGAILQITDFAVSAQWGYCLYNSSGAMDWYGSAGVKDNGGRVISHADTSLPGGKVTISTAAPSGGQDGDIWLVVT